MKKSILSIAFITFMGTMFTSCHKQETSQPIIEQNALKTFMLSADIIAYDQHLANQKVPMMTEKDVKLLCKVATADLGSAWQAFKLVARIAGPGYGGAAALLAGIGGSLYTWWLERETKSAKIDNPNTGVTLPVTNPEAAGEIHNKYVQLIAIQHADLMNQDFQDMSIGTHSLLATGLASEFNLSSTTLATSIPVADYQDILDNHAGNMTIQQIYDKGIADGTPVYLCDYMNEFLTRAANPATFTYDAALSYSDLFIADIKTQSFTPFEKDYLISCISIYKNSLKYWHYNLN